MKLAPRDDGPFRGLKAWLATSRARGFTFAEMLIAIAIASFILIAAVMAFQAIGQFQTQRTSREVITFSDSSVMTNFYGTNTTTLSTWTAPSYGYLARVEQLREKYYEDVQKSIAIYCLPRVGRSSLRTSSLPIPAGYEIGTYDYRKLSTPEEFRKFLVASVPSVAGEFATNAFPTGDGVRGRNLSVLMLRKSSWTNLNLHCIYEIDFVRPDSPGGVYASVRRYEGTTLTHYYDTFYPDIDGTSVNSDFFYVTAFFSRTNAPAAGSVANIAGSQPFYLVWFPDPAAITLPGSSSSYSNSMADRTSLMFVTPMFPSL
jgi:prepilin-type N-terminal cleavage/methylation domain-containing protein